MTPEQVNEIIACLPTGRTLFYYCKGGYAPLLLSHFVGDSLPVWIVKQSRFGRLLRKPIVKDLLAGIGDGVLRAEDLRSLWSQQAEAYRLTLGRWGKPSGRWNSWGQTSRPGMNLVLQLNFSNKHNAAYVKLLHPGSKHPFVWECHPVAELCELTLAWSRLDIDLDSGEALIEEVQSDWVRDAFEYLNHAKWYTEGSEHQREILRYLFGDEDPPTLRELTEYVESVLRPHMEMWAEAMLAATIWFLRVELGVRRILYHTYHGGNVLKKMKDSAPPRSLYTDLPRQFCFEKTTEAPSFYAREKACVRRRARRMGPVAWFALEL